MAWGWIVEHGGRQAPALTQWREHLGTPRVAGAPARGHRAARPRSRDGDGRRDAPHPGRGPRRGRAHRLTPVRARATVSAATTLSADGSSWFVGSVGTAFRTAAGPTGADAPERAVPARPPRPAPARRRGERAGAAAAGARRAGRRTGDGRVRGGARARPPPPPPVGVASFVVADLDTGAVLAARAPHARQRPASTLKLLTLVVTDRLDPDAQVAGAPEDPASTAAEPVSAPAAPTPSATVHGLMLNSGNDAASALARTMGGVPATLAAMQDQARRLGALDTRPATVSGLDGPGMSSSAYDLALFFRAAAGGRWVLTTMRTRTSRSRVRRQARVPDLERRPAARHAGVHWRQDRLHRRGAAHVRRRGGANGRRLVVVLARGEQRPVRMVDQAKALLDWGFAVPRNATPAGTLVREGEVGPPAPAPGPARPLPAHRRPRAGRGPCRP